MNQVHWCNQLQVAVDIIEQTGGLVYLVGAALSEASAKFPARGFGPASQLKAEGQPRSVFDFLLEGKPSKNQGVG